MSQSNFKQPGLSANEIYTYTHYSKTTRKSNDKAKTFYGLAYGIGSTFDLDGTGEPSDSIITEESVNNEEEDNANKTQNRDDLAQVEINQAKIIKQFLPKQLSESEIEKIVNDWFCKLLSK